MQNILAKYGNFRSGSNKILALHYLQFIVACSFEKFHFAGEAQRFGIRDYFVSVRGARFNDKSYTQESNDLIFPMFCFQYKK